MGKLEARESLACWSLKCFVVATATNQRSQRNVIASYTEAYTLRVKTHQL